MEGAKYRINKINDYLWEIPQDFRKNMRVPARVYATEQMLRQIMRDRSLEQLINVTTLPGIQKVALAMPDAHEGYGFPIGGVAATEYPNGSVSPGGIGYDINCGVRLVKTGQTYADLRARIGQIAHFLNREIPSGVGRGGRLKLDGRILDRVLTGGAEWAVNGGYGETDDLQYIESSGTLRAADPGKVSERAKRRGLDQCGTMGAGNHFVEIDRVDRVYDEERGRAFGLFDGQIVILIHTGSRGLGHQIATDYIRIMMNAVPKYGISVPDRELVNVPFSSPEGQAYFGAMSAAANFAWANRQMIMHAVRQVWKREFGGSAGKLSLLYDVAHNIAKIEEHEFGGVRKKVILHRKGATRAFGPGSTELPEKYRTTGQPVIIPGSMGTASYVLAGTETAMRETFGSTCHGAGRAMSRMAAKRNVQPDKLKRELRERGITVEAGSVKGLVEEAPQAYKDINNVVDVVYNADIATKVARLRPLAVIKG